jgi:hypothetical protein
VNLMRQRRSAALFATIVLALPIWVGEFWGFPFTSSSSSLVGVQLAQEGGGAGEYFTDGPIGGSAGGPATIGRGSDEPLEGSAACESKSAGDSCSFIGPDGQTVSGTCTTIPNQLLCIPAGATFYYRTGEAESQPEGAR